MKRNAKGECTPNPWLLQVRFILWKAGCNGLYFFSLVFVIGPVRSDDIFYAETDGRCDGKIYKYYGDFG